MSDIHFETETDGHAPAWVFVSLMLLIVGAIAFLGLRGAEDDVATDIPATSEGDGDLPDTPDAVAFTGTEEDSAPVEAEPTPDDVNTTIETVAPSSTSTAPNPPPASAPDLYVDPNNSAATWAAKNSSDPRAQAIADAIGSKPIAKWFGDWNFNVRKDVADYVSQASAAGAVPIMVVYNIPDRDCGQHSAGGATSFSAYQQWIDEFAAGLGNGQAFIVLEPDSIALNGCAGSDRNQALANAISTIKAACAGCQVYLDAGHSNWVGPSDMAARLTDAGVLQADGFFTNASNYYPTANEAAFGQQVLSALGNPAGIGQVIDVSRNGNGSDGEWCDPAGRKVGADPTVNTGSSSVHAHLWIKVPGEADGCIAGAGEFVPQRAYELAIG